MQLQEGGSATDTQNKHGGDTGSQATVVVVPRKALAEGWVVMDDGCVVAAARNLAEAEQTARSELARLGGGRLEVHLRYGRVRLFDRVGTRVAARNSG